MADQQRDILSAPAQRRQGQFHGVQPVVQVFSDRSVPHHCLHIHVCGRNDPHIHVDDLGAAQAHHLFFLQHPQQLYLKGRTHPFHLIQKQRSPVGALKKAKLAALLRPGKRAVLIPKQLALQQVFRHGRAVDGNVWPRRPQRGIVDGAGQQFFSRPALSGDDNRRIRLCHFPGHPAGLHHRLALSDDIVKRIFCCVSPVQQPQTGIVLPVLHIIEALKGNKQTPELFVVPDDVDAYVQRRIPVLNQFFEGLLLFPLGGVDLKVQKGKRLFIRPADPLLFFQTKDLHGISVDAEDIFRLIDSDSAPLHGIDQQIHARLHLGRFSQEGALIAVKGVELIGIRPEFLRLQNVFHIDLRQHFSNGSRRKIAVSQIIDPVHIGRHQLRLPRRNGHMDIGILPASGVHRRQKHIIEAEFI